nr:host cell division inhibitor Icd-like protein [Morganella morganii]
MLTWCSLLTILVVFTLCCSGGTNSETPQWWNTNGASNHSDNASIEVAMSQYITPVTGRNSLTPNQSFRWLFLALERGNPAAKPHRIEATAPNEHCARLLLVRDYILAFAGRLPVREVAA